MIDCRCGAKLPELAGQTHPYMASTPACWATYTEVLAREYGDPAWFAVHRQTVDCYAVQHPGRPERRAIQSVNAHLVALHLMLEAGASAPFAGRVIGAVADRLGGELFWLDPPADMGALTIADIVAAASADEHCRLVRAWAASVWQAWSAHHAAVRALAGRAVGML